MYSTPGNDKLIDGLVNQFLNRIRQQQETQDSAMVDENYQMIGAHLDRGIVDKIINHKYVDFARLLPEDHAVIREEDHCMEIVNKGGYTYFVPVSDCECGSISSFQKWEQAFRILSNVYTRKYPHKASELIQYNHIICMASQSFTWENVYLYDKEFRLHLSNFPQRSWAVILQQACSMCLKDCIRNDSYPTSHKGSNGSMGNKKKGENCHRFNKGKCTAGNSCKYDHRCDECRKWGHGAHICRK